MSKTKNFRRRGDGGIDEGDEAVDAAADSSGKTGQDQKLKPKPTRKQQLLSFAEDDEDSAPVFSSKKKGDSRGKPPRKPASSSLLSFEGDEGGFAFNVQKNKKKSGYGTGHGSGHQVGAARDKTQAISNVFPQAGEYTPERLQELQKNTIRLGGVKPQPPPAETKIDEPLVILKGVLKPVSAEVDDGEKAAAIEVVEDVVDYNGGGAVDGQIPDAAAIAAAKAQRERRRKAQTAPDYIPLGTSQADFRSRISEEVVKPKKDDSSDDEAEVRGRLTFIGSKSNGATKAGVFEFVDHVEEEDEEKIWEEEQLKKGVGKRVEDPVRVAVPALPGGYASSVPGMPEATLSVDQQAECVMIALQQGLKRIQESHARSKSELYSVEQNMSASEANIRSLEENFTSAGNKYIYMQQLRDYVASLCDFLQEKSPLIEQLEEHMLKLHEDRASAVFQKRTLDISDEKAEVEAAIGAAMGVLGRGGTIQTASAQAQAAVATVFADDLAPELDEFGRDMNLQKRTERKLRADARNRKLVRKNSVGVEAEISSDESESEERAFQSGWDDTLETAEKVFSDASEEFSQLEMVKNRLEAWNQQYPAAYRDAYVTLSAPAIFAPFVRLELLKWDPLHDSAGFQHMRWYSLLVDYDDADLVPSLIEKIALPLLHFVLERCWDRLSARATENAVAAVLEVLAHVPASSKALQDLIALVKRQLAEAVSEMQIPHWSVQVLAAVPQAAQVSAYRFGASVKLLRNIGLWKRVLARSVLDQLALDEILNARILPHLRLLAPADSIPRTARVVEALQGTWIGNSVEEMSPKLGGFVKHVVGLGRTLEKKQSEVDVRGLVQGLRKMLLDLNEKDRASEVAQTFQLKEAAGEVNTAL